VGGVKPPVTITDGVVALRQLREGDRAFVIETMRDPVVQEWLNMPLDPGNRDFDALLRTVRRGWESGERFDYVITERGEDVSLGAVVASRRHRDNYELAYLAREAGRGRGIVTRAVSMVCDVLLDAGIGRLEVRTHTGNAASQRLAERCGFRREGTERKSIWLHGRRADAIVWSRLPEDRTS
jgi:RimJ/RimL family protein N-acetyltransferase